MPSGPGVCGWLQVWLVPSVAGSELATVSRGLTKPRTSARLTAQGRAAFEQHVAALQQIVVRSGATILPSG